ncbi:MAG: carboxypeptidase regulatory-like domain-containing protein [Acidobacteria bacterium]|nr:carboxypeptidase regulatory-like domain-containing protein [Acidobacteriota bacterium]MBI3421899.1 carboxypeptidase regulatory-like domain-containing protein [Acidobacteriota bacterium]
MHTCVRNLLLSIFLLFCIAANTAAQTENTPPSLRRVTLYKHGVGYFERQGKVNGDGQVTFLFDAAQMNDVLKSLVALDLGKGANAGKITGVTYDSTKPLDRRLEEFGVTLDGSNAAGMTALIGQFKGARVSVRTGGASANAITGTVVGIEKRAKVQNGERSETQELVLLNEAGELFSLPFEQMRSLKLLDAKLREDLDQYLSILQSTLHKNLRKLTIATQGTGERDLFISYVVEAPVWKTTYRIVLDKQAKPFLQGWAVVDNVQDEDWTNVTLSLIAGAPVSFIQDLQQPRYKQRPVVGMPDDVSITPMVPEAARPEALKPISSSRGGAVEGVITDAQGAVIPGVTIRVRQVGSNAALTATADSEGRYRVRGVPQGLYALSFEASGFQKTTINSVSVGVGRTTNQNAELRVGSVSETVTVTASAATLHTDSSAIATVSSMRDKDSGIEIHADTQEIGELFEYRIAHPVTIKRNSSALIPILQNEVAGELVSLYNKATRAQNPMSAFYLHNTTGLTLESGPLTVIENDTYAGEALTARIKPNEKRFITYAVDLGVRVSVKEDEQDEKPFFAEIRDGEFRLKYKQARATVYTLANVTDRAKTVYIEHPYDKDEKWQLAKSLKPVETTESFHRFKVTLAPNASTQFAVNEELPETETYAISNLTSDKLTLFVTEGYLTAPMRQALETILDQKAEIAALNRQAQEKQAEINAVTKDQERMRDNLRALGKTEDEKLLVQRYVGKLAQGEDQLERLRQEEKQVAEKRNALQRQIEERLKKLAFEQRLK